MAYSRTDRYCNVAIGFLAAAILHAGLILFLLSIRNQRFRPEPPEERLSEIIFDVQPEPPKPEPPQPEPPKPEPPQPEPPQPEPPKPEPPKPEPPQPEPPKPEPPKPEPPKPEPPKPKPLSIRERLAQASVQRPPQRRPAVSSKPLPAARSAAEIQRRWANRSIVRPVEPTVQTGRLRTHPAPPPEQVAANYAEIVVKPLFYEAWRPPRTGDRTPSPALVELDVLPDGRILNIRISRRSDDVRMNRSVEELIREVRLGRLRFTPFSELGIRAASLHVAVTMTVAD